MPTWRVRGTCPLDPLTLHATARSTVWISTRRAWGALGLGTVGIGTGWASLAHIDLSFGCRRQCARHNKTSNFNYVFQLHFFLLFFLVLLFLFYASLVSWRPIHIKIFCRYIYWRCQRSWNEFRMTVCWGSYSRFIPTSTPSVIPNLVRNLFSFTLVPPTDPETSSGWLCAEAFTVGPFRPPLSFRI